MPVPGDGFEGEVIIRREVAFHDAEPDDQQHYRADCYVHAVETGEHEERRAVDTARELQVHRFVGVDVFLCLQEHEDKTEDERQREEQLENPSVTGDQCMVCDCDRDRARQ